MNYIDDRAQRILALSGGGEDFHAVDPKYYALYRMYAVLSFAKGLYTTREDVHDAWSAWCVGFDDISHRSLKPFDELTPEVQALDDPYVNAIHQSVIEGAEVKRE